MNLLSFNKLGAFCFLLLIPQLGLSLSRISLLPAPATKEVKEIRPKVIIKEVSLDEPKKSKEVTQKFTGNLPSEYLLVSRESSFSENPVIIPSKKVGLTLSELKPGDIIEATIPESVFAYENSKAPLRAIVNSGPLKDSIFIGESRLESNSKRIMVNFTQFRHFKRDHIYSLSASALDLEGVLGVRGEIFSNEALYFGGELLSAGAAGFTDSTIDRSQNLLGNYVEAPSLANATKRAVASALSKTTERFSEKLKSVPEYAVLKGPVDIKIIVTKETNKN